MIEFKALSEFIHLFKNLESISSKNSLIGKKPAEDKNKEIMERLQKSNFLMNRRNQKFWTYKWQIRMINFKKQNIEEDNKKHKSRLTKLIEQNAIDSDGGLK